MTIKKSRPILSLHSPIPKVIKLQDNTEKKVVESQDKQGVKKLDHKQSKETVLQKQSEDVTTLETKIKLAEHLTHESSVQHFIKYLIKIYPKCFSYHGRPLAVGIKDKLYDQLKNILQNAQQIEKQNTDQEGREKIECNPNTGRLFNMKRIGKILGYYTRSFRYQKNLFVGAKRRNLDGTVSSLVTEKEILFYAEYRAKMPDPKKSKDTQNDEIIPVEAM